MHCQYLEIPNYNTLAMLLVWLVTLTHIFFPCDWNTYTHNFFLQPIDHWLPIRDAHTAQARGVQEASISMT